MVAENSEVSPVARLVAVADEHRRPGAKVDDGHADRSPHCREALVVICVEPEASLPRHNPDGSAVGLVKNWIRNVVSGRLLKLPTIWVRFRWR